MSVTAHRMRSMAASLRGRARFIVPLGLVLVLLVTSVGYLVVRLQQENVRSLPANLFMQSIVTGDGELGWRQLCPSIQKQVPLDELRSQATAQHRAEQAAGITLNVDFVGARPQPQGGEVRIYLVTAHRSDGQAEQRTFIVRTRENGCVEDLGNAQRPGGLPQQNHSPLVIPHFGQPVVS